MSREERLRQVQQRYEKFESIIKLEKDSELIGVLAEIARDIEDIENGKLVDSQHIQVLHGVFLPKYFKLLLQRKYYYSDIDRQILVTQFINVWLKNRVPHLSRCLEKQAENSEVWKELEILEMIFNSENEIYNFRVSRNTPDIEDRLTIIYDHMGGQEEIEEKTDMMVETVDTRYKSEVAVIKRPSSTSYFFVHNINVFSKVKGFEGLLYLVEAPLKQGRQTISGVSMLKVCLTIMTMMSHIKNCLKDGFWVKGEEYGLKIAMGCKEFIYNRCTQEDLRLAAKKDIMFYSSNVESILDSVTNGLTNEEKIEHVYKVSESLELELALKCLKMPVLEKKLIGHQILISQIFKVRASNRSQRQGIINMNLQIAQRWLTSDLLLEWLDTHRVFDLVFGDSLHAEVIKKSYSMLDYLYSNGRIERRELDKMWQCATQKHEAYKVAILKALSFLATKAKIEDLQYLFNKLKQIPLSEVDKFCLDLIKSIAKKLAGDVSVVTSPLRSNPANNRLVFGPAPPQLQRSNSGDRQLNKQKARDRLNNSFSNGVADNQENAPFFQEPGLDNVLLHKKKKNNALLPSSTDIQNNQINSDLMFLNQGRPLINNDHPELPTNPLEVPAYREDQRTADEDLSFNEGNQTSDNRDDIFNNSIRDDNIELRDQRKNNIDLEEEKEGGDIFSHGNQAALLLNLNELLQDQTLDIETLDNRDLAHQILDYLWLLCQENTVSQNDLSIQAHKYAIDELTHLIKFNYQKSTLSFIARCVGCLLIHQSVVSMHVILHKLITNIEFPLDKQKILPKNRQELIAVLDKELNLTNVCLSSYIEFKRISLNHIFDQMGSQEHEQENLETQSSLDNDEERSTSTAGNMATPTITIGQPANRIAHERLGAMGMMPDGTKDIIHIQEDSLTVKSNGSMFLSPRMKVEEEFKIPKSTRTYSFKDEGVLQKQTSVDYASINNREGDMMGHGLGQSNLAQTSSAPFAVTPSNKNFNSQSKKNNGFQMQSNRDIQQNLANNQFRMDSNEQNPRVSQQPPITQNNPQGNVNRDFLNSLITNEVYKYSYYEELHHRLDFLKFIVGSSPSILKPQQLQVLWECLVINAFYERERDQFFNWCTQILVSSLALPSNSKNSSSSIIAASDSIFNDDCLEMLFFDTLLKLDFRYITEIMYECFEKYFIYINEQYGQIVTTSTFAQTFEVFETKLIGIEALWEILLCARNVKVYKSATEFLHKIYKKMSPTLIERLNEIKEELLQTCMEQVRTGLNEIKAEMRGGDGGINSYEVPIYQLSQTIEDPKNRVARSLSQLCKFIDEFEGLRDKSAKSQLGSSDREINVIGNNQIGSSPQPKKITVLRSTATKIGLLREEFANALFPKKNAKEISMTYKGRDLTEDLKSLKDLGISQNDNQIQIFISLKSSYEMDLQDVSIGHKENNEAQVMEMVEQLKMFMPDFSDAVIKLAVQKCNLNMDEAANMLMEEDRVIDLQEEVRKSEEANTNNNIIMIVEDVKDESDHVEDSKLNLIISNRSEYFDLLFELLNLGITEITNAAWNLLIQIPVNKTLLHQIRTLSPIAEGSYANWCQLIDPSNAYKMLYSIQIVNSLISVNNEKLSEPEIQERYEWRLRFLELGGFEHLYSILITAEPDEFLATNNQRQIATKKKGKNSAVAKKNNDEQLTENKDSQQIQNNQAKCLGYLIGIIKIFIQAALLTADEDKLLTLIAQSSTSPFRKPKTIKSALQAVPSNKFTQLMFGNKQQTDSLENSRDNSSANTPKFQSSHSSTPQCSTPKSENVMLEKGQQISKSLIDPTKVETIFSQQAPGVNQNELYTQVDDFPRLVEQISGPIAQNLLEKVVNFNGLVSKLLNIIYKAVMFCDSPEVSSLVQNSLDLLLPCIVWRPQLLLKEIYDFENLESLLIRTLMHNHNENVRRSIERTFKIICNENFDSINANIIQSQLVPPKVYILRILLKNLPETNQKSDYCEEYFNLITHLMRQCQSSFKSQSNSSLQILEENPSPISLKHSFIMDDGSFSAISLLKWCIYQLKMRPTYEDRYNQYTDKILAGYLQLTQSVLEINQDLKKLTCAGIQGFNMIKIIFDFLFLLPSMEDQQSKHKRGAGPTGLQVSDSNPKCKMKFTRKKAFNLLLTLCHQQEDNFVQLLQELFNFHAQIQKSQQVVSFEDFDNEVGLRSGSGYVGLKNFGCTCYMNALIQQLFMINDFKKGILESDTNDSDFETNVLYQMKLIFANLQESEKQYYAPEGFTKAFQYNGAPVNVRQQQDTFEFYNMLGDNLENLLKDTPYASVLKDSVGGLIANETRSLESEFPYVGESEEPFFAVSLDIKNKKTLAEALDMYIKPDHLEGDNKYFCDRHNRKIDVQRRSYLKKLSNTVIINLKRFEYDYNSQQRLKLNDYCEFPERINFKPWTKEGIRERESQLNRKSGQQEEGVLVDLSGGDSESDPPSYGDGGVAEESKHGGEAIDEDESDEELMLMEDEENTIMNTGKYFDEGVMEDFIDIAADDEEVQETKKQSGKFKVKATSSLTEENKIERSIKQKKREGLERMRQSALKKAEKDDNYYEYELVGVLVHSGSADAGHYYSYIKERQTASGQNNGRWLEFNDKHVTEFDPKNLGTECFGGEQDKNVGASRGLFEDFIASGSRPHERCRNAYLLFYERVQLQPRYNQTNLLTTHKALINGIESNFYQRIWDENAAFMKLKIFFDQEYFSFARDFVNLYSFEDVHSFTQEHSTNFESQSLISLSETYINTQLQPGEEMSTIRSSFILNIFEIMRLSKQASDIGIFYYDSKYASLEQCISMDPGLHAIKLATILSQDIIMKVKDMQSFVLWMQLLDSLYERHAVACVWFIQHLNANKHILVQLLIESQYFEVRESFAKLLITAISVTAKTEESYMTKEDDYLYYDLDLQALQRQIIPRSSIVRFMQFYFCNDILNTVLRANWRHFDEYFQVLASFAQLGFAQMNYLIVKQDAINRILEFVMNSSAPYYSSTKPKMGDRSYDANFMQAVDLLSILIRAVFTRGIQKLQQYSPESLDMIQNQDQRIAPFDYDQFPLFTSECFTSDLLLKAVPSNDSLLKIVTHLCWGDPETSEFFINEIVESIKKERSISDLQYHLKILSSLMRLNENNELQVGRLNQIFSDNNIFQGSAVPYKKSLFGHLNDLKGFYSTYVLKMLQFIFSQAVCMDNSGPVLIYFSQNMRSQKEWIGQFLNTSESLNRMNPDYSVMELIKSCIQLYNTIFAEDSNKNIIKSNEQSDDFITGQAQDFNNSFNNDDFSESPFEKPEKPQE